ncbi:MAG: efflux RND transporter periplasmic adaptor subunit [Verrucomicrobia bacterium]|nr:efflux RND transporter periplasmic adaptor subunit [Verrucomicrobiota bacterium]
MNEATLRHKRKIVEIPIPSFSWKILLSPRSLLIFSVFAFALLSAYWVLAVRPYLWLPAGYIDGVSMQIRANEAGKLDQLAAQAGDRVNKGQILFAFESEHLGQQQRKIEKNLLRIREQQKEYRNQSEKAMQDYLADLGLSSHEESEQHLLILQEAQTKVEELDLEAAALDQELSLLKAQLNKLEVTAPFDGVVLKQKKVVGDYVNGGESVLSLFDLSRSWIEVRVPEKKLHLIQLGQPVKILLASYPGKEWEGAVSWVGPATLSQIEGTERQVEEEIPIKISFPQDKFPIKPGLSAEVGIKVY